MATEDIEFDDLTEFDRAEENIGDLDPRMENSMLCNCPSLESDDTYNCLQQPLKQIWANKSTVTVSQLIAHGFCRTTYVDKYNKHYPTVLMNMSQKYIGSAQFGCVQHVSHHDAIILEKQIDETEFTPKEDTFRSYPIEYKRIRVLGQELAFPGHKYRWRIKVKNLSDRQFGIGVIEMQNDDKTSYEWENGKGILLIESDGPQITNKIYPKIESGDIVTLELDLTNDAQYWHGKLSFGINENWYGMLCEVGIRASYKLQRWYRLCVEVRSPGITVEIIDFRCYDAR